MPVLPLLPADMPCDVSVSDTLAAVDAAFAAWGSGEIARFYAQAGKLQRAVPCVHGAFNADQVASIHMAMAVLAFSEEDNANTLAALRAAALAAPGRLLPEKVLLATPDLRAWHERARGEAGDAPRKLVTGPDIVLIVDGSPANAVPGDRPALVQVRWKDDKTIRWTGYLTPDSPALDLSLIPGPALVVAQPDALLDAKEVPRPRVSGPLAIGAGAATTISLAALGASALTLMNFYEENGASAALPGTSSGDRVNLLTNVAIGAGMVAVGLDVTLLTQILKAR